MSGIQAAGGGGDEYFNDMSRQEKTDDQQLKAKRIACMLCRKRKLKCDGGTPACVTCVRLQHVCMYDGVRRKSGPKRGYVKALEARLAQVEMMLSTPDVPPSGGQNTTQAPHDMVPDLFSSMRFGQSDHHVHPDLGRINQHDGPVLPPLPARSLASAESRANTSSWEMISLGMDELLPPQDVSDELDRAYFHDFHPSTPMIHRAAYYTSLNSAPHMRPPLCLRYAMWCSAAGVTDKYRYLHDLFYQRARKYLEQDEMKGHGEGMLTLAHCQAWVLVGNYELSMTHFPRAFLSSGRAVRASQLMGLHELARFGQITESDFTSLRDWTDMEERRRTFWACFCLDRHATIATGHPLMIDEDDISTPLPCDKALDELHRPYETTMLSESMQPEHASKLSGYAGRILLTCLYGRNVVHLRRTTQDGLDADLNGEFWMRHRQLDNILKSTALALPEALRVPTGLPDPNVITINIYLHVAIISLHLGAIVVADNNHMPGAVSAESKGRCTIAAAEIASIARQISHLRVPAVSRMHMLFVSISLTSLFRYMRSYHTIFTWLHADLKIT